jgi:hypothetical protein
MTFHRSSVNSRVPMCWRKSRKRRQGRSVFGMIQRKRSERRCPNNPESLNSQSGQLKGIHPRSGPGPHVLATSLLAVVGFAGIQAHGISGEIHYDIFSHGRKVPPASRR